MPKKFDEQEKTRIQQQLLAAGREQFTRFGFKKTNVEDLTRAAGIATGTFYKFYRSKEELFFDLLEEEELRIHEQIRGGIANGPMTKQRFKQFMTDSFRLMAENPIIREVMMADQLESIIRKLPPERLESNFNEDQNIWLPLIKEWQRAGLLRNEPPEIIVSMLRSIVLLSMHKREIGELVYEATIQLLIDTVGEGLFVDKEEESS